MDFDLIVIGSGPGGYVAAIRASQLGKKVGIVERSELGGICLNWGCIPTKALLRTAEVHNLIKNASSFGLPVEKFSVDFAKVINRSREIANRLSKGVAFLMKKNKVEIIVGTAEVTDKNSVEVTDEDGKKKGVSATNILIATGARARNIPGMEIDGKQVLSYREAMVVEKLPKSIVVIGGGAIGVEFAYFFRSLGSDVTIIEMLPHLRKNPK